MPLFRFALAAMALLVTTTPYAQERTASGNANAQMTWSALSTKVDAANIKSDAVNTRVDQIVVCGKKGMTYAPGTDGADAQGCMAPQNITKIINCGKQGAVYSAETDACIKASPARWFSVGQAPTTEPYGCQYNSGFAFNCKSRGIPPPSGFPVCGTGEGQVARLCDQAGKRCARHGSATATAYVPAGSCSTRDQENNNCSQGGMQTSTSSWYDLYACE